MLLREDKLLCLGELGEPVMAMCVVASLGNQVCTEYWAIRIRKCVRLLRENVRRSEQMKDLRILQFAEFAFTTHLALFLGLILSYPV